MARGSWPTSFAVREASRSGGSRISRRFSIAGFRNGIKAFPAMQGEAEAAVEKAAPTGPADAAVSRDPGTPDTAPDDANDLRGFHFRRLIHKRATWLWGGIPTVVLAIAPRVRQRGVDPDHPHPRAPGHAARLLDHGRLPGRGSVLHRLRGGTRDDPHRVGRPPGLDTAPSQGG